MRSHSPVNRCLRVALYSAALSLMLTCAQLRGNEPKPRPASVLNLRDEFAVPELRDSTGLASIRMWFAYFGDHFPVNLEFLTSAGRDSGPIRRGVIVPPGTMTLKELLDLSTRTLGAIMYTDATGTNLEFRTETARPNPFNGVLKKASTGHLPSQRHL
jgi:hypothetical protein